MRKIINLLGVVMILAVAQLSSCGKGGGPLVQEYVDIIDRATESVKKVQSLEALMSIPEIEIGQQFLSDHEDYALTDKDKDMIKKSFDKFLKATYEKTSELSGLPREVTEAHKDNVDLIIQGANAGIDNARTLGDLNNVYGLR